MTWAEETNKKHTQAKIKGRALHWPNEIDSVPSTGSQGGPKTEVIHVHIMLATNAHIIRHLPA